MKQGLLNFVIFWYRFDNERQLFHKMSQTLPMSELAKTRLRSEIGRTRC